ncbi:MAG: hypothetical protein M1829_002496 [Trizodia sp. TS-e1964]|nr:MAG: hypothetical protein M1829_002496 [Trizodia sp. TS-e1964]
MSNASSRKGYVSLALASELLMTALVPISAYMLFRYMFSKVGDPDAAEQEATRIKSAAVMRRLDSNKNSRKMLANGEEIYPRKEDIDLTKYEQIIALDVVAPEDIPVSFEDIGGLSDIIEELKESVIYPLTLPHLFANTSSLLAAPSGVLLYGPPGCGKTMLAKALAHESGASFINLHISTLTEKWYGDSNKLVNAVFSLARKLQPSIVFIDEIDAVLGTRRTGEHEASGMVKAEFMTHWDGLASASASGQPQRIMVLGATNRIQDIDEAILRRMPKKFPVSLPSTSQRRRILSLILRDTRIDKSSFDIDFLARVTAGMSGSDIKEACRDAAMGPVKEFLRKNKKRGDPASGFSPEDIRGVRTEDFFRSPGGAEIRPEAASVSKSVERREDLTDDPPEEFLMARS